jgi:hypothetical protein
MTPTTAPTLAPTFAGFKVVEKEVETKAVVASLKFDVTVEQAKNLVMQHSMTDGFAGAMSLLIQYVEILEVTESGRRLQGGTPGADVKFKITSPDPDDIAQLEKDVKEGAAEGAVVANIIKKAADNKVLTPSLRDMEVKVDVQTSVVATTTTVAEVVEDGEENGNSSGPGFGGSSGSEDVKPKLNSLNSLSDAGKAGIAIGVLIFVFIVAVCIRSRRFTPSAASDQQHRGSGSETPVGYGKTEGALIAVKQK